MLGTGVHSYVHSFICCPALPVFNDLILTPLPCYNHVPPLPLLAVNHVCCRRWHLHLCCLDTIIMSDIPCKKGKRTLWHVGKRLRFPQMLIQRPRTECVGTLSHRLWWPATISSKCQMQNKRNDDNGIPLAFVGNDLQNRQPSFAAWVLCRCQYVSLDECFPTLSALAEKSHCSLSSRAKATT